VVGVVKRWRAALAASTLAIATVLVAGSCWNPLNGYLIAYSTLNMVWVDGGTLTLGSDYIQPDEGPLHDVTVSTFLMSPYEIPQGLYQQIMGINPSYFKWGPSMPVERVSWLDAIEFCNALSTRDGLDPCYLIIDESTPIVSLDLTRSGYRLPTEAEWEFAARGGLYGGAYTYAGSNNQDDVAWHDTNADGTTHPVGELQSNDLDLYDMSGNVMEWCWDGYSGPPDSPTYYEWLAGFYPPPMDPLGPNDVLYDGAGSWAAPVLRGGGYVSWTLTEVSARFSAANDYTSPDCGFRVVRRP
jgi:formylglycine-generating enzyme required for sulfatase activity